MKKIITICLLAFMLTGCNRQIFDLEYTYDKAVCNYDGNQFELKIDKWSDYEGEQLQIISNGDIYLISANKCYLVKDNQNENS
ncbi:MAG: membrane lipoprotein lipid attachment site-containing protein [Methanobrevibacter sp.]|nr:membrane lipoprotein lipid attachment site-containing protein [Methanobrevibacter sp.]